MSAIGIAISTIGVAIDAIDTTTNAIGTAFDAIDATINTIMQEVIQFCLDNLNYWTVALFMAIESSFIPFPSEVVVPPAAWLACTPDNPMNIFLVVVVATLGADIGALVNYYLARYLGRPVIYRLADSRFGHLCLLSGEKIAHAEEYFRQHGVASTFFGRLVPAVRQLISIPAGLARMKFGTFLLYTTLGAACWNGVLALLGWVVYKSFPALKTTKDVSDKAAEYSGEIGHAILIILGLVIVYFIVRAVVKRRKQKKN